MAPPHIRTCVIELLKQHLTNERIIGRNFLRLWLSQSLDINLRYFWLWCCLKSIVYGDKLNSLAELKAMIYRDACNIPPDMLRATIKNAVMRFNLLSENGCHHIEHAL